MSFIPNISHDIDCGLTLQELEEIADYTIQKIISYPKHFGKTVENYFDLLFPDEVKSYLVCRAINSQSSKRMGMPGKEGNNGSK